MSEQFIERRKEPRLPYSEKIILTDGESCRTAYAANISRGGFFIMSLDSFPIDTFVHLSFFLPHIPASICLKGKTAHIVYDKQRCEIECGMGIEFVNLAESQKAILNTHMLNEQRTYTELQKLFETFPPDPVEVEKCLGTIPSLKRYDLLALRYKVHRICTIFEATPGKSDLSGADLTHNRLRAY
jgi:Tfp pilus assembly protein PilZ